MIPLLPMNNADILEFLQVTPGPFPDIWVGPGDEATVGMRGGCGQDYLLQDHVMLHWTQSMTRSSKN